MLNTAGPIVSINFVLAISAVAIHGSSLVIKSHAGTFIIILSRVLIIHIPGHLYLKPLFQDPLRRVPGPVPLPLIGNALMLKPNRMHSQLYDWAGKYGPVMKFSIFHQPFVVLNSLEVCLEAKLNRGEA